jgi:hypothetical protein
MIGRQIFPIHLVGEEHVGFDRQRPRDTTGIRDRTRWPWLFLRHAAISAFQNDVAHVIGESSAFQERGKGNAGPFRIADRTELPLCARYRRRQEYSAAGESRELEPPPMLPLSVLTETRLFPGRTLAPSNHSLPPRYLLSPIVASMNSIVLASPVNAASRVASGVAPM